MEEKIVIKKSYKVIGYVGCSILIGGVLGAFGDNFVSKKNTDNVCRNYYIHAAAREGEAMRAGCDHELHKITNEGNGWILCKCPEVK